MTFVDLVFPAFLFIMGMSIPFALGARLAKHEPGWKIFGHVALRTVALLSIGILMVHETPDTAMLGWSGNLWCVLMYLCAIAAFCSISTRPRSIESARAIRTFNLCVRLLGLAGLVWLAFAFRGAQGQRIITLSPFSVATEWYGILGLIGWAYLVTSIVFLVFGRSRAAVLGCMVLLMCLFAADKAGAFEWFWLRRIVGIGETLGSLPAISTGGLLLGLMVAATQTAALRARTRFAFWFIIGCSTAALLLNRAYGISKNQATPSWCLWACAITAGLWYVFYLICDVRSVRAISLPFAMAGENVLLAYLISEMAPGLLATLHLGEAYGHLATTLPGAIARSILCAILILVVSVGFNRVGFRLKL